MMEEVSDTVTSHPDVYSVDQDRAARVIQQAFRRLLVGARHDIMISEAAGSLCHGRYLVMALRSLQEEAANQSRLIIPTARAATAMVFGRSTSMAEACRRHLFPTDACYGICILVEGYCTAASPQLCKKDMNVFKYFRNLINFKGQGDPRLLLKCINPREAEHIDAAAGVHVRFRLGGTKFPPNIYYKLFTHRPIVDVCANSPKDYTKQSVKQLLPKQIHNHCDIPEQDRSGWYTRVENNGWRLLTLRVCDSFDDVTAADSNKRLQFNHSKLTRRQDVLKKQKQRKMDWMRKMYYEGSLHARTADPNTAILVQRATQGIIQSVEKHGAQAVLDWEVDELLNWTNALNYEEYIDQWKAIGTSKSSCAFKGTTFVRSPYDFYEFSQLPPTSLDSSEKEEE